MVQEGTVPIQEYRMVVVMAQFLQDKVEKPAVPLQVTLEPVVKVAQALWY
jgi:hypothetical protein